jgi:hypothetical protein
MRQVPRCADRRDANCLEDRRWRAHGIASTGDLGVSDAALGVIHLPKQGHLPKDTLVQTSVKIVESPLYIACSKDLPDSEIVLWQKSLDKMKKTGKYATIRSKYGE